MNRKTRGRSILALALAVGLLAACGPSPQSPQIVRETVIVEVTREVTREVEKIITVEVTVPCPTQEPTATPSPTPKPAPTPTPYPPAPLPKGWWKYEDMLGEFTVGLPGSFSLSNQKAGYADFKGPKFNGIAIFVAMEKFVNADDLEQMLKGFAAEMADQSRDQFQLKAKGIIQEPTLRAVFIEYETYDRVYEVYTTSYAIAMPLPDGRGGFVSYFRVGARSLTDEERDTAIQVARTFRLAGP